MTETQGISALVKFTLRETFEMSTPFRTQFVKNGSTAHALKCYNKRRGIWYEISYHRNGFKISATHKNFQTAKQLFIEATYRIYAYQIAA